MGETAAQETIDRTQRFAEAMQAWLDTYFSEIAECCTSKGIPRPPNW
ncbi:MAG: hypothetical protein M3323_02100 [Actinomycetota bacterium]|nr:hypothetical protein [Actinomycetota bacterium]